MLTTICPGYFTGKKWTCCGATEKVMSGCQPITNVMCSTAAPHQSSTEQHATVVLPPTPAVTVHSPGDESTTGVDAPGAELVAIQEHTNGVNATDHCEPPPSETVNAQSADDSDGDQPPDPLELPPCGGDVNSDGRSSNGGNQAYPPSNGVVVDATDAVVVRRVSTRRAPPSGPPPSSTPSPTSPVHKKKAATAFVCFDEDDTDSLPEDPDDDDDDDDDGF
jgi:hypothetical protein